MTRVPQGTIEETDSQFKEVHPSDGGRLAPKRIEGDLLKAATAPNGDPLHSLVAIPQWDPRPASRRYSVRSAD